MRKRTVSVLAILTLAATVVAQDFEAQRGEGRGPGRRGRGPSAARLVERLGAEIEFDDEQTARIEEIVAAHGERMREFREQREAVRDALDAGDDELAARLREQLRWQRGQRRGGVREILGQIEPLLHDDQLDAFQRFGEDVAQRGERGGWGRMRRMIRDIPDAVDMTEEQRSKFEQMLAKQRETMRERMRERFQQAEEGGLEEAQRPAPPDFSAIYDEVFDKVAEMLNEDQLELLDRYQVEVGLTMRAPEAREGEDLLVIVAAANRLRDLSSQQKDEWRQVKREAMEASRKLRGKDKEGKAALAAEVKTKVLELLDEEQEAEFERNVERLESRQKRERHQRVRRRTAAPGGSGEQSPD